MKFFRLEKDAVSCETAGKWYCESNGDWLPKGERIYVDKPLSEEEFELLESLLIWCRAKRGVINDEAWKKFCNEELTLDDWEEVVERDDS